jgi:hypothetical protein
MENETDKLARDLQRYRFLLSAIIDPQVIKVTRNSLQKPRRGLHN